MEGKQQYNVAHVERVKSGSLSVVLVAMGKAELDLEKEVNKWIGNIQE